MVAGSRSVPASTAPCSCLGAWVLPVNLAEFANTGARLVRQLAVVIGPAAIAASRPGEPPLARRVASKGTRCGSTRTAAAVVVGAAVACGMETAVRKTVATTAAMLKDARLRHHVLVMLLLRQ